MVPYLNCRYGNAWVYNRRLLGLLGRTGKCYILTYLEPGKETP